ncbi:MAG: hypothetical protein KGH59_00810 [Candidatus Micrarchaeota archaeon]|nr:hypothetical protein [Candidatus Micrarchaeota archaeon]MDE1846511.1 hypothetical protein [Candidatus Micrarchaeota archaeon]
MWSRSSVLINANSDSLSEIISLSSSVLYNYRASHSAIKALEAAVSNDVKYETLCVLAKRWRMSDFGAEIPQKFGAEMYNLLKILHLGASNGVEIEKNLEDFHSLQLQKSELRNMMNAKVSGMQTLSVIGVILFFPLFSGIASSIASSSLIGTGKAVTTWGIRSISMLYIIIVLCINRILIKPWLRISEILQYVAPLAGIAYALQSASFGFSSYVI